MAVHRAFFRELKRRNVLRAAVLYAGAVWALSQGVSQLSPALGLPDYATRWFLIACLIGFPFWAAFAWFYEFTPHGFRRDAEIAADAPLRYSNARRLDFAIIGVLVVAVALLASGYFVRRDMDVGAAVAAPAGARVAAAAFSPPEDTLVVLPFGNLGGDPAQQYFSDGVTEELTNVLGRNVGMKVIAWDTASRFRNSKLGVAGIARALDVANVLTGKILRQGDQIRVIVELVNARTGFQVWSDHYDDSLANVFQVQDKISAAIATALQVKFASVRSVRKVDPRAHDLVLRARALIQTAQAAKPIEQARGLFEQAIAIAPDYPDAHAGLAGALLGLTEFSTLPMQDILPKVRAEAHQALAQDSGNVEALLALANADASEGKLADARAGFKRALALDPSNAFAHVDLSNLLPLGPSLAQVQEAVELDPDNATAQNDLAATELDLGAYTQALAPAQALVKLAPHSPDNVLMLAEIHALLGQPGQAVQAFDLAQPDTDLSRAMVAAERLTYRAVQDPPLHRQALDAVDALRKRPDLDPGSMIDVIQLYLALREDGTALGLLPAACATQPVNCSDLSVNPLFVPLRGKPRFVALVSRYDTVSKPPASAPAAPTSASP